ncbi:MAG: hypothetical protein EXR96_03040 [Nitrospiraceae bacterium]|nr:hypothetical protein [Nitrospiraceae bacterium]
MGQLGNGNRDDSLVPVAVKGIASAKVITTRFFHTCALLRDGKVKCWGKNLLAGKFKKDAGIIVATPVEVQVVP